MTRAALALGSNVGDRLATLEGAVRALLAGPELDAVAASSVYETEPVGGPEQGPFLNAVLVVETSADPHQLLELAGRAEALFGRVRLVHWGPRTLDVDVLSFGDLQLDDPQLTLPHPRAAERAFVLLPWAEVDPGYVLPGLGTTVGELADRLPQSARDEVRRLDGVRLETTS